MHFLIKLKGLIVQKLKITEIRENKSINYSEILKDCEMKKIPQSQVNFFKDWNGR